MPTPVVILVPGFLGSTLSLAGFGARLGLWLNPPALLSGLFRRLALPTTDRPDLSVGDGALVAGGPLGTYYGLLDYYLDSQGWDCHSPDADFRRPIAEDAARLVNMVRADFAAAGPVRIVCHSRGGLVTRVALGTLAAAGQLAYVARVVGMGVPHVGSLNAVSALSGRAALIAHIETLSKYGYGILGRLIDPLPVRGVLRSWPSLYQLLPDPARSTLPAAALAAIYSPDTWGPDSLPPYAPHLSAASAAWAAIPPVPAGVEWIDVAGFGTDTAVSVPAGAEVTSSGGWTYSADGDGTVPLASATQAGRRKILTPTQHDMLPNDGRLWPWLDAAARGTLVGDVTLSGRVLALPG